MPLFTSNQTESQDASSAKPERDPQPVLHPPFTRAHIAQAVAALEGAPLASASAPPRVRVPVRVKIAFPFALLALLFAIAAAYVVSQVVADSMEERFQRQLVESGQVTTDLIVREENRLLRTWRLAAYTQGVGEATAALDVQRLRELVLPIAVNNQEEAIEILNLRGESVLSLRHVRGGSVENYAALRGENVFANWDFVQNVLAEQVIEGRDKFAGVARSPWSDYLYVAGPLFDAQDNRVGAILIGKTLTTFVQQLRQQTLAHTTIYDRTGYPIASTLFFSEVPPLPAHLATQVRSEPSPASLKRDLAVASINYQEIVGLFETRDGSRLGLIGAALPETYFIQTSQVTRAQIFILVTLGILLVIAIGAFIADQITHPLLRVVRASSQVAMGNLQVAVDPVGNDEVADLAQSFNYMVSGLREGFIYRDLLGRTVSPEVRDRLRDDIAAGRLRLSGQDAIATVLMADIRGFTTLSEHTPPTTVLNWLNEYFGELVPIITARSGVVNKFDGDAMLAFFGILPALLPPAASAYQACCTALEMIATIDRINARRIARGEPPFVTGIGVNTGPVTAGGLGTADRLNYTIIGDTVNTTQRLEEVTRQFGESGIIIGEHTWTALRERRDEFRFESLGPQMLRGKQEPVPVYRLWSNAKTVGNGN